jgi:hypothetical protein
VEALLFGAPRYFHTDELLSARLSENLLDSLSNLSKLAETEGYNLIPVILQGLVEDLMQNMIVVRGAKASSDKISVRARVNYV